MACEYPQKAGSHALPGELVKDLKVEMDRGDGNWSTVWTVQNNRKRLLEFPEQLKGQALRLTLQSSWGELDPRLFSIDTLKKDRDNTIHFPIGPTWKEVVAQTDSAALAPPDHENTGESHKGHSA
jgi:hypothetical protein